MSMVISPNLSAAWSDHGQPQNNGVSEVLLTALSSFGRMRLAEELRQALDRSPDDPTAALRVVEAWWRTALIRRDPMVKERLDADQP